MNTTKSSVDPMLAEIESCEHLYLGAISEPRDNSLRLLVEEAVTLPDEDAIELPGVTLSGRPIRSSEHTGLFELVWDNYVAYSVVNESYASHDQLEVYSGRLFRVFSKSRFLDYLSHATFATAEYPGPIQHCELVCLNHVIDVASTSEPHIRWLRRGLTNSTVR